MNDDSNFDDLESDSDFDKNYAIGTISDEIGAKVIIDDTELQYLDENEGSDIPVNSEHLKIKRKNNHKNTIGRKLTLICRKILISNLIS